MMNARKLLAGVLGKEEAESDEATGSEEKAESEETAESEEAAEKNSRLSLPELRVVSEYDGM